MRRRLGIWAAMTVVVFAAVLTAAPTVLQSAHVRWPAWPIALAGAVLTALVALAKPAVDAVAQRFGDRAAHDLDRQDRARELEHAVGGRRKGLPSAGEITNRALLGMHPSIPLPVGADASLSPDLPLYIPRDLDADLRSWITAHQESGGFLLLVGPVACGKTRCAYELAHDLLADWPTFMPSTSAQLANYFEANPAQGKLVVWLDETQNFLGPDGLTIATVRQILALSWPVIIIGTMSPQAYDTLAGPPDRALGDANQVSREILTRLAQRKDLLPRFSRAELNRAASLATRDPRIAEAMSDMRSWNLTETLAAAPDLISRWLNASDPYGAAVITAAVIARRCGHPEPLPAKVLQSLALTMLTAAERGRATAQWFQAALVWARAPVRGPAAPLTPQATTPGVIEGDQVSDVLVQYAARDESVPGHIIPEPTWLLLVDEATPNACGYIVDVAYWHRQLQQSPIIDRAIRRAAAAKDAVAMFNLGVISAERGRFAEAAKWYREAAAAKHTAAMYNLGLMLGRQSRVAEAEKCYREAAAAKHTTAMYNLGNLLRQQGKIAEAEKWYREAAAAKHTAAMYNLGLLLERQGKIAEAEKWYREAAAAKHKVASYNLAELLKRQGEDAEAEKWYREAAAAGYTSAMYNLGESFERQGEDAEAEKWYREAAAAWHTAATYSLGNLLRRQGKVAEAEKWYREAAAAEHTAAMYSLGNLLKRQGKDAEAEMWYRTAAAAEGPVTEISRLGLVLQS
jgi:TPR repeat protein